MVKKLPNRKRSGMVGSSQRTYLVRVGALGLILAALSATGWGIAGYQNAKAAPAWTPPPSISSGLKNEGTVQVLDHLESTSSIEAQLFGAVLKAFGGNVKFVDMTNWTLAWTAVNTNPDLVEMEIWGAQYPAQIKQYTVQQKTILAPKSSVIGREGWYVPTYVIKGDPKRGIKPSCPGLPNWKALNGCAKVFATPATGSQGQYLAGAAAWAPYYGDAQRIKNLHLNYKMVFSGSEAALVAGWERAYTQGKPLLALIWQPHYISEKYNLTRVEFPPPTGKCWGTTFACNWPPQDIRQLVSAKFPAKHPTAWRVIRNWNLNDKQMGVMLALMSEKGLSAAQAVQQWMNQNPSVWHAWAK